MLFIRKAFSRFDLIQYYRHAFSYVLVQVTVNVSLVRVKLLRALVLVSV